MTKYVSLSVAHFEGHPNLNKAHLYIHTYGTNYKCHKELSYEQGMKALRRMEKQFGKLASLIANEYSTSICYKEIDTFYS